MPIPAFSANIQKNNHPETWTNQEINAWFGKKDWLNGWVANPDISINKRSLAIHYFKNQKHWDQMFRFLQSSDLANLPLGKQELDGSHLYISVDAYTSKDKEQTRYESHRQYIDVQYLISGQELMGLATADKVEVSEPYNEEKDVAKYIYDGGDYILANPSNFLVFFPGDIHRPCIKVQENEPVKKIVVKILIE